MRHPLITTTAEQDLKELGILSESTDSAESESLDEAKLVRKKRSTAGDRMKWRRDKKKGSAKAASRKYRNKASTKRMRKKHDAIADRRRHGKEAGRTRLNFGTDAVSNMMESTESLLKSIEEQKIDTAIQSFANMAITAELLARTFSYISEDLDESGEGEEGDAEMFADRASFFAELAKDAARAAKHLRRGDIPDEDALSEAFKERMSDLLEGLALFDEATGGDDDDDDAVEECMDDDEDDDEDLEESEEEGEEEDEEEDDEDDEEEEEPAKKPLPFTKRGK